MPDFLLELRMEEIPARMQAGARAALEKAFREHLAATGVSHGAVTVWSTPRRLALIALSAENLVMGGGGTIGAATPVQMGQPGAAAKPVAEKTAWLASIACS